MRARDPWVAAGAGLGFIAVAAGAFGAHALKARLEPRLLEIWQTAAHYHLAHALALVAYATWRGERAGWPAAAFAAGIAVFSGSLYVLALTDLSWLGAVTPFGGLAFLAGWAGWAWAALGKRAA